MNAWLDRTFSLTQNKTTVKTEVIAGLTTFMAMAYILASNPKTLADPAYIMGDPALAAQIESCVFIATCLGAFVGTTLMALLANLPFALAPGLGLNATFAYTVMLGMGYSYAEGLAIVFISGVLFFAVSLLGLREAIVRALPHNLKVAISAGIGLFIAFIGLVNGGIVINNDSTLVGVVNFSDFSAGAGSRNAVVALVGLLVIAVCSSKRMKGGMVLGILIATAVGIPLGVTVLPEQLSLNIVPMFSEYASFSLGAMFSGFSSMFAGQGLLTVLSKIFVVVISLSLIDMFDTIGTLVGTAQGAGMLDEHGDVKNMKQALLSDSIATMAGAFLGTSTVTTFVESSAGVSEGGRTGLSSVVTALLFLASLLLAPFIGIIPLAAAAPALIYVGVLMIGSSLRSLDFSDPTEAIPAFLTMIMMPLTYGISNGIAFGIMSYVVVKCLTGKFRELNPTITVLGILFILRYALMV